MLRIGHGYDAHRLVGGRPLFLGGVEIPFEMGLDGHSDADAAVHAVMDALLGAMGEGDIGRHFPPGDPQYKGISSLALLGRVGGIMRERGWRPVNLDVTIIAEKPRLAPYIEAMRAAIWAALSAAAGAEAAISEAVGGDCRVNVKATTEEGMGFTGAGEGIAAHCVCLIEGAHQPSLRA